MKRIALLLLLLGAAPAFAQDTYKCELKKNSPYGWIPPELFIQLNEREKTAIVFDGFIKKYLGDPIPAELSAKNSSNYELNWTVPNIKVSNGSRTAEAEFKARWNRPTGRMNMTVFLSGGTDMPPPTGSGRCKPFKR